MDSPVGSGLSSIDSEICVLELLKSMQCEWRGQACLLYKWCCVMSGYVRICLSM